MYQDMYQQGESFMKQFNEILTLNAETMSTLCEKQAALVNSVMTESIDYAKDLPSQKSAETFFESQKAYWESMQQKISDNAKDSLSSGCCASTCGEKESCGKEGRACQSLVD